MPWEGPVRPWAARVLRCLSRAQWELDGGRDAARTGSFAQRLSLPQAWAGLRDAELAAASGVADAVFVHVRRFVGAARSREGALAMAR